MPSRIVEDRQSPSVEGPWYSEKEQNRLRAMWPKEIEFPKGMKFYKSARYSQRIAITNGSPSNVAYHVNQDDHWGNSESAINPNRIFPWAVSGGLHESTGWVNRTAVAIPEDKKIEVWEQPIPIANGGLIPGKLWSFPPQTTFADMLIKDGEVFELRTRTKRNGQWDSAVVFRDKEKRPLNFVGARKECSECHDHSGSSKQYGIMLRGGDGSFSAPILREGSVDFDFRNWPLVRK